MSGLNFTEECSLVPRAAKLESAGTTFFYIGKLVFQADSVYKTLKFLT